MNLGDIVLLTLSGMPALGQVVAFTEKRVRIALKQSAGYVTVLRAPTNLSIAKKAKRFI